MSDKVAAALGPDIRSAIEAIESAGSIRRDPAHYDGRYLCIRCGRDQHGDYWPGCTSKKPDGTQYTHEETCARYGEHDWMCDPCERLMNEELAAAN